MDELQWANFRISTTGSNPLITFTMKDEHTANNIVKDCKIPYIHNGTHITFKGCNAIDAIHYIPKEKRAFNADVQRLLSFQYHSNAINMTVPRCKIAKISSDAIIPFKTRESDVGYDVSVIGVQKVINSTVTLYRTGLKMQVDPGWYAEIVPRSSLIKSGYMLANSVGIIDNSYMGELMIALAKVDKDASLIEEFPFRGFQLIFRPQQHVLMTEVSESEFDATERGDGGFGSTGK